MFERKLTHLRRCCKILPKFKTGLMYNSTLRFQNCMHKHLFEPCALHMGNFSSKRKLIEIEEISYIEEKYYVSI